MWTDHFKNKGTSLFLVIITKHTKHLPASYYVPSIGGKSFCETALKRKAVKIEPASQIGTNGPIKGWQCSVHIWKYRMHTDLWTWLVVSILPTPSRELTSRFEPSFVWVKSFVEHCKVHIQLVQHACQTLRLTVSATSRPWFCWQSSETHIIYSCLWQTHGKHETCMKTLFIT